MATYIKEFDKYKIAYKSRANSQIHCYYRNNLIGLLTFHNIGTYLPTNMVTPRGEIYLHYHISQFNDVINILRYEKPLCLKLSSWNRIGHIETMQKEMVGEEETSENEGTFIDIRDGNEYKWIRIGEQIWMAENLAFGGTPYNEDENNRKIYGSLYEAPDWGQEWQFICPEGWHIPTDNEWKELEMAIGMNSTEVNNSGFRGTSEGAKLKASNGWNDNGNGTDEYGFSAQPGGMLDKQLEFSGLGTFGLWWSSTRYESGTDSHFYFRGLEYGSTQIKRDFDDYYHFKSIRCVKD